MATTTHATAVDTAKVSGRRRLHFDGTQDILTDADALAARGYRPLGNWTLGQVRKHLATGMAIPLDGTSFKMSWPVRFVARLIIKPRLLRDGMKPGFKLNAQAAKLLIPDRTSDAEGIAALRNVIGRAQKEPFTHPHPFFGPLTRDEWNAIGLRHAELHLSFLLPT